ncbi:bifunctional riboflavin kinase/FAD synthetase [Aestuariirhabdus sp. Z084]|uniref:bifunctional riboflavin kinase/FAD synthetase n=1 Tax=Aestuariirhabdus haliotis TaxID=2918751 RepID=UPI00201B3F4D|nr:bifunctional riboflavin kinase/FAD synthetase [Aestuariirhabdus haliotis]MCL6416192.1 bifunctional riboflavin kinase/FAD synthetase [Aestuariirhabdus haliotis]MCL6420244.1 bifunctional riboflavin kinase/FAD synthetase [Aestuariirhabdus haliotis]
MQLIRGLQNLGRLVPGCVATIGNFDGVHRGHQDILTQLHEKSEQLQLPSAVVLFEPQPREFFAPDQAPARLSSLREKLALLTHHGVDRVVCLCFNQRLRSLSADQFIDQVLVQGMGVRYLVVGDDFRFGCDRSGDFHRLQRAGLEQGFAVTHTRTILDEGERVSSTRVRAALAENRLDEAERLLGAPYAIRGRIAHGQKLGRELGVPTANVQLKRLQAPLRGVFAVRARVAGKAYNGVANIGMRPTVDGRKALLEVHLLDFDGDLYGQELVTEFVCQLRDEKKFESLDALTSAIHQDIDNARKFFVSTDQ